MRWRNEMKRTRKVGRKECSSTQSAPIQPNPSLNPISNSTHLDTNIPRCRLGGLIRMDDPATVMSCIDDSWYSVISRWICDYSLMRNCIRCISCYVAAYMTYMYSVDEPRDLIASWYSPMWIGPLVTVDRTTLLDLTQTRTDNFFVSFML